MVIERSAYVCTVCWCVVVIDGKVNEQCQETVCSHLRGQEIVPVDRTEEVVEALRAIVTHSEMPAGESWPTAYSEVVSMAREALDRIGKPAPDGGAGPHPGAVR